MIRTLFLSVLFGAASGIASASSLYVTASGTFSSTDTADSIVVPGDSFSLSFVVNSNPTLSSADYTTVSFDVPTLQFSLDVNGTPITTAQPSEITFDTAANGGGFSVQFPPAASGPDFLFSGPQLFTGPTSAPVFSAGSVSGATFTYLDSTNYDPGGPAAITLTPTPEPSSVLLLFCGGLGFVAARVRKSVSVR